MKATMTAILVVMMANWAQGEEGKLQITGSWETAVDSIYLGPEGLVLYDKPIIENSLTLSGESGWSAGIWTAFPLQKESVAEAASVFDGEIDIFAGFEKEFGCLKLGSKLMYWVVGDLGDPADDIWSANLKVSMPKFPFVQPFAELEHCGEVGKLSPKGGNLLFAGFTRHQPLGFKLGKSEEEQALDLELRCAWSDGAFNVEPGYVYTRLTASSDFQVSKACHITPQILYQLAGSKQAGKLSDDADCEKLVARLAFRVDF